VETGSGTAPAVPAADDVYRKKFEEEDEDD
jgi:hypothetical protein